VIRRLCERSRNQDAVRWIGNREFVSHRELSFMEEIIQNENPLDFVQVADIVLAVIQLGGARRLVVVDLRIVRSADRAICGSCDL
jgi:hypothetical protein